MGWSVRLQIAAQAPGILVAIVVVGQRDVVVVAAAACPYAHIQNSIDVRANSGHQIAA